jgi:hypothetical protein
MKYKHRPFGAIPSAFLATALATALVACQSESVVNEKPSATPHSSDITPTGESLFLSDENGNVPRQIPPAVLADMIEQLKEQGQEGLVADIQARYNLKTGMVLDLTAAAKAESFLKSRLPSSQVEPLAADSKTVPELPAPEYGLPPELKSHFTKNAMSAGKSMEVAP